MSAAAERRERLGGILALAVLLLATVVWWALALWPVPGEAPEWLARARSVCFNTRENGLPDASGWLLLIGQPLGMLAALMVGWGRPVRAGIAWLGASAAGRTLLVSACVMLLAGLAAAGVRVGSAQQDASFALSGPWADELPPDTYPRLDRPAPGLDLVDQSGSRLGVDDLRGRIALVTFAFGHCETVCPAVVRQTLEAQARLRERAAAGEARADQVPRVVVVTLDPWRDTPSRLPHLAQHWKVDEDAHLLSGEVADVERVLDGWNVARQRDANSGDVTHPPLVYILDAEGRIAYASTGGVAALVSLAERS